MAILRRVEGMIGRSIPKNEYSNTTLAARVAPGVSNLLKSAMPSRIVVTTILLC
jgi:hypothetical protein